MSASSSAIVCGTRTPDPRLCSKTKSGCSSNRSALPAYVRGVWTSGFIQPGLVLKQAPFQELCCRARLAQLRGLHAPGIRVVCYVQVSALFFRDQVRLGWTLSWLTWGVRVSAANVRPLSRACRYTAALFRPSLCPSPGGDSPCTHARRVRRCAFLTLHARMLSLYARPRNGSAARGLHIYADICAPEMLCKKVSVTCTCAFTNTNILSHTYIYMHAQATRGLGKQRYRGLVGLGVDYVISFTDGFLFVLFFCLQPSLSPR